MTGGLGAFLAERLSMLPFAFTAQELLDREAPGGLDAPGVVSANRHCRLLRARDAWVALNLARPDDRDLMPALCGCEADDARAIADFVGSQLTRDLIDQGIGLHLPLAELGEAPPVKLATSAPAPGRLKVVDLSALWAGPLCAGLLARAGAQVMRIESVRRRDPTPLSSPTLDRRLNGLKRSLVLDFRTAPGRSRLMEEIAAADVLVTSARRGALAALGLDDALFRARPNLIWAAVTAHGWSADRVGFGDDCAVAGGLVRWMDDTPRFLGDALADPLTGLEGALAVLERVDAGEGGRIDLAMARTAAAYRAGSDA